MPVYRSIRIQMPDRPGALSAVSTALAVQGVNIVRLDIMGHDGDSVVDDLLLSGPDLESIGRAIGSFQPDVTVRTFDEAGGDPTLMLGEGILAAAAARDRSQALDAVLQHARVLARADRALLSAAQPDGRLQFTFDGSGAVTTIESETPFVGRWALHRETAMAIPLRAGWAPEAVEAALSDAWLAIAPIGPFDLLLLTRSLNIPFLRDELERIAMFAEMAGAVLRLRGELSASGSMAAGREAPLPERTLTLGERHGLASSA
jgi:hypothetical protein